MLRQHDRLVTNASDARGLRIGARGLRILSTVAGFSLFAAASMLATPALRAATPDADVPAVSFHDGRFEPATLTIPAHAEVRLRVTNLGSEPIEFESFKLNRERVVSPGETVTLRLPELSPGSYDFYDDFHRDVPEGVIVVK
jgi:plastocyanin